jgi:hypothetical protein
MNPTERQDRIKLALANPVFFGEYYIRPFDPNWTAPLPRFAHEMMRFGLATRRGVVILPPEFLKTTLLSQVLPIWLTYRWTYEGKLLRGMLLSEEEGMATNNLSVVAWHIENNPLLQRDFCDGNGRPVVYPSPDEDTWRDDAIITARVGASKDPTWQAKGLDSKGIQGRRIDWLIGDDVITPRNAESPAMRKRALHLWDMQITTRLVAQGKALICGNFNDTRDLLMTLAARESYEVFKRPALHDPHHPEKADPDGVATWPQNWSKERLEQERKDKPQRFRRIFLLDARAEMGERLQVDWMTVIEPEVTPLRYARYFIGVDPAPGGYGDDLDFFNATVLAVHETHADIVECIDIRGTLPQQISLVGALHDRYQRLGRGVIAVGGARVALDRYFRGALENARKDLGPKIVDVSIPGQKEERLEALGVFAQTKWLRVWRPVWFEMTSASHDQWQEQSLFEQWRDFPHGKHDDKLDGLDVAIRVAREFAHVGEVEWDLEMLEAT